MEVVGVRVRLEDGLVFDEVRFHAVSHDFLFVFVDSVGVLGRVTGSSVAAIPSGESHLGTISSACILAGAVVAGSISVVGMSRTLILVSSVASSEPGGAGSGSSTPSSVTSTARRGSGRGANRIFVAARPLDARSAILVMEVLELVLVGGLDDALLAA